MAQSEAAGAVETVQGEPFAVKDCALVVLATGKRATTLKEFRDNLAVIDTDSIYFHFWGGLLQPRFEQREYNNDFASWARRGVHSPALAERLAMVAPTEFEELEDLRQELLQIVDEELDEHEYLSWIRISERFEFIRSQIVVFDTHHRVQEPGQLADLLPQLSAGSIFYHFIDARRRLPGNIDDFRYWLGGCDGRYAALCDTLAQIDPYFGSLTELRGRLAQAFAEHLPGGTR